MNDGELKPMVSKICKTVLDTFHKEFGIFINDDKNDFQVDDILSLLLNSTLTISQYLYYSVYYYLGDMAKLDEEYMRVTFINRLNAALKDKDLLESYLKKLNQAEEKKDVT